jgi:hypothetical protein
MEQKFEHIVYMKFGYHAKKKVQDIIASKKKEFIDNGFMFWGYGGSACNPFTQVLPFLELSKKLNKKVHLVMAFTTSKPTMEGYASNEFSTDGINWQKIPDKIKVTGSKHAIVCGELIETDFDLNLGDYSVALGSNEGKNASAYIKGQSDKGCFVKNANNVSPNIVKIELVTEILSPYAVKLR